MPNISRLSVLTLLVSGLLIPTGIKAQSGTPETIQFYAQITADKTSAEIGETVNFTVKLTNDMAFVTATNPVATIVLPAGTSNIVSSDCTLTTDMLSLECPLAEVSPESEIPFTFNAEFANPVHNVLQVELSADQQPATPAWLRDHADRVIIETTSDTMPADAPVELSIEWVADGYDDYHQNEFNPSNFVVRNTHTGNTAYSPVVEFITPQGWSLWPASYNCDPVENSSESGELKQTRSTIQQRLKLIFCHHICSRFFAAEVVSQLCRRDWRTMNLQGMNNQTNRTANRQMKPRLLLLHPPTQGAMPHRYRTANRQMKLRLLLPHPPAPGAAPHRYR